jgi:hypothetical protein
MLDFLVVLRKAPRDGLHDRGNGQHAAPIGYARVRLAALAPDSDTAASPSDDPAGFDSHAAEGAVHRYGHQQHRALGYR